jgi:hypothetical protein
MKTDHFNPVTRSLIEQLNAPDLAEFVAHWDALERLVVGVFRSKEATPADEVQLRQVRSWLGRAYRLREEALRDYWAQVKVAGEWVEEDPFAQLLAVEAAADFVENWSAMQTLPAAREALNRCLIDLLGS